MAAPKYQYPGDRFDRPNSVHLDFGAVPPDMAAVSGGLAARRSDYSRGEQFRIEPHAEGLWHRPGYLGISAVRDNFHCYRERPAETEINLLTAALGPDIGLGEVELLVARFGDIAKLHEATTDELTEILQDRKRAIKLKSILQIGARIAKPAEIEHPVIGNCVELVTYLQNAMGRQRVETFRVLFLDTHNRLISDEVLWRGTISEVQVYPREVIRRALQLDSSAFIAAHNHPSNVVTPSASDIDMTKQLLKASAALGIIFHDHFIVSARSYHSMRFHKSVLPWSAEQFG
jgi:DNA repair protein RadC